jgi:DNA-binding CsgD family transcriptional regulator
MSIKARCALKKNLLESTLSQKRVALTQRQGQILSLVTQGLKNKEIAFAMGITEGTVKVYLYKVFQKLGMNDRLDMALYGRKNLFSGQLGLERTRDAGPPAVLPSLYLMARKQPVVVVAHWALDSRRHAGG